MALNSWQKLTRVLPGMPFGTGADGDYSSATAPTLTKDSCSGAAAGTSLTTAGSTFANGDILLIHQTRGTGAGQWEINKVASGGGTANLTLAVALQYTYTDSGASQAQAIKIPMYKDVTVQSGTWSLATWNGNIGGILALAAKSITVTGNMVGDSSGFVGGVGGPYNSFTQAYAGEGSAAATVQQQSANGNGGGGNNSSANWGGDGGGGGSYGSDGENGNTVNFSPGAKGSQVGANDLTAIFFGGSGGGGGGDSAAGDGRGTGGTGGNGGGIIILFCKDVTISGYIYSRGGNGGAGVHVESTNPHHAGGGGGAGGAILIVCANASIGTDKLVVTGGARGVPSVDTNRWGGAGGKGRIAVYYGTSLTGSISSSLYGTYTNELDTTLKETAGGMWLMF